MPLLLYDLPTWLMGVLVSAVTVGTWLGAYGVFRRVFRNVTYSDAHTGLAMSVLGIISTMMSLLLAFSAVSVWESHAAADEAVVQEANTLSELARDLDAFDSVESRQAREKVIAYTRLVIAKEWPQMRVGQADAEAFGALGEVYRGVASMEPDTPRHVALMPEVWGRTNELLKHRRERLHASESAVPGTLWAVVLLGTALAMFMTFVLPPSRFNVLMIGALALSVALVLHLVIAMDRPFTGRESISPEAFEQALDDMRLSGHAIIDR